MLGSSTASGHLPRAPPKSPKPVGPATSLSGLKGMDAVERSDVHLLRPAEVVELLGVSRSWLYDAANSGRIPCVRLGSSDGPVRFRLRELEAWIEEGRVVPRLERVGRRETAP